MTLRMMLVVALAACLPLSGVVAQPAPPPVYGAPVSLEQARAVVAAARAEARRRNFTLAFAVVEPSGSLVLFERMDGVLYGSVQVAQDKARSAALYRRPTKAFADAVTAGRLGVLGLQGAVAVEGGVPLLSGGRVVGALGVSGASSEQDGEVAQAGAAALSAPR